MPHFLYIDTHFSYVNKKFYFSHMILVTGATGMVGAHLIYSLLRESATVRATYRTTSDFDAVKEVFKFYREDVDDMMSQIEWVIADITEIPALEIAFVGVTRVYHCAALISFDSKKYIPLKKTNIEGTANVVNQCLKHRVEKLCYVSTIAILGETLDGSPMDEDDDWNPETRNNVYAITKYGAEMEVWRGIQEGLNAVIVNPGVVLGEGYFNKGSGEIPKKVAKGISYYTSGSTGFVDVQDVTKMMIKLMKSSITNERFILVGANETFQKILSLFSKNLGVNPPRKPIKKSMLLIVCKLDALGHVLFGRKRQLYRPLVESLYSPTVYNASKIETQLRIPFTPIEETIARISKAYSSSRTGSTSTPDG